MIKYFNRIIVSVFIVMNNYLLGDSFDGMFFFLFSAKTG